MYIGYLSDRQELGFSTIKNIHAVKELSDFKSTLKNPVTWIITKGKQILILIFSKEVLVSVLIFLNSNSVNINPDVYRPSFRNSMEVYRYYISRCNNSGLKESLKYPSPISDYILKLKGGSDKLTDEEQEKLIRNIIAKAPQSSYEETSINKLLKRLLKKIEPVISDQRFWKIFSELGKPIKSELSGHSEVRSTDILGPSQNAPDKQAKTQSRGSSSFFAEALNIPNTRKLSPMQKRVQLKMAKNNFSNNLESSGLSRNHKELSENIQFIEKLTRLRRAQPLYPSEVLCDSYKYGGKQLERKAPRHLPDFGISIVGKSIEELAVEYKDLVENILSKQGLIVREDGMMNQQEPAIIFFDPDSQLFASFENNPLYEDHHFISSYEIGDNAVTEFITTGNIGKSPETRKAKIDQDQKLKAAQEQIAENVNSFYQTLPQDARIGNNQLREAEAMKQNLREDPNLPLTEKEKDMIQRAEKYQQYKNKFYQNNPDIDKDEL